jgi:pimeloyl-ACP methyl ester carboxylesterase
MGTAYVRDTNALSGEVRIPAGNVTLAGELIVPRNASGLTLFAHGSGSSRFSPRNQFVARILRERGLGTLLFDLLTAEEERVDDYTKQFRFNIELLARRLVYATNWTKTETVTRDLRVGFFGASTGGGAALVAAAEMGPDVCAVVSRGGRPDLAGEALHRVTSPTLLIVGELDEVVISLNTFAYEELRCEKRLTIIPKATHLFEEPGALEKVAEIASDWFQKHLCATQP